MASSGVCVWGPDHQTPPQNSELWCGEENNPGGRRRVRRESRWRREEGRRGRVCPQYHLSFFLFLDIVKKHFFLFLSLSHNSKTTSFPSFFLLKNTSFSVFILFLTILKSRTFSLSLYFFLTFLIQPFSLSFPLSNLKTHFFP